MKKHFATLVLLAALGVNSFAFEEVDCHIVYSDKAPAVRTDKLLVVVDYQVDFVDGAFGKNQFATGIENAVYAKIKEAVEEGDRVVFTMDTHPSDVYSKTREGNLYKSHCDPATNGWQLYGKVREYFGKFDYVEKCTFGSKLLMQYIAEHPEIKTIELIGVATNGCVFNCAILCYNMFPKCEIKLDYACCASSSLESHNTALRTLKAMGCAILNAPEKF